MTASEEPPAKKQKSVEDWADHKMNIGEALMKADEGKNLVDIVDGGISTLQGIGPISEKVLEAMGLNTVKDLATYKYYLLAKSIKVLSETESDRPEGSVMNIDNAIDKEFEAKSLTELLQAPIHAIEGLTENADTVLKELHVKTIGDLADFKYCKWAEAIVELAKYEELKTKKERHLEHELKKLA
mmetsp:Transcript_18899/g.24306  ORF Transcript_18899/g.24306 Transcript_18899/m.24306 type:complete len:185 (-) Transcript_18899:187-741(-)|eukprot:CAMPEP_0198140212 /NCGR_PEP_ID=MMETSP1443-20131203/3414_1 /TAXON_ID=186043 /ORGANISM="Entomoneis sp., Strain CCMP2396" /LENGTH=184 /DNA_ID=CAMNT_0043802571 /DNA_START=147 /DNA_END=701 /DNA_ORIENTATION=+